MGARILVVEDNAANRELVRYLLASAGHEVLLAIDGAEGVALARARRPALILSDLQMPRLDGYAMLAALRADPACAAIPVVALTAFSMPNDRDKVQAAGFDGYLSKPFEPETFCAEVDAMLERATQGRRG